MSRCCPPGIRAAIVADEPETHSTARGQSTVVGVALLIAITVTSLGLITAGAGVVVEEHAQTIGADAATTDVAATIDATGREGRTTARIRLSGGRLETIDRTVRVHDGDGWRSHDADGIRYVPNSGDQRVVSVAGTVLRRYGDGAVVVRPPEILTSERAVIATIPVFTGDGAVGVHGGTVGEPQSGAGAAHSTGNMGGRAVVRMTIDHETRSTGSDPLRIAIETAAPDAVERAVRRTVHETALTEDSDSPISIDRRQFDGDAHSSVVVTIGGEREGIVLIRAIDLELRVTNEQ